MKKKYWILFAGLLIALVLLLCASAGAAPLTTEEIIARNGKITEAEKAEYLNALDQTKNDLSLGKDYTLDGRKIRFDHMPLTVSSPDGSNPRKVQVPMEDTYYEIADDVVLVQETNANLTDGRPAAGTTIALNTGNQLNAGGNALKEGSKVVLLETNGDLHAFYAGEGTNGNTLVVGKNLYVLHCFKDIQIHTPKNDVDIPISIAWGTVPIPLYGYIKAGDSATLDIHIDVDSEWKWYGPIPVNFIYLHDFSMGIDMPNMTVHTESIISGVSIEVPLVRIQKELAYGFVLDMSPTLSLEGTGNGDTVMSVSAREGFSLTIIDCAAVTDIGWNHTDPKLSLVDMNMVGELYYGFSWGPGLSWVDIAGFSGTYKVGMVVSAEHTNNDFHPDDPNDKDWHVCEKDKCVNGFAFLREGPFSANITLLGYASIPIISSDPKDHDPFAYYYFSETFDDKSMSSPCPHWAYRLDVNVEDTDGNVLPDVSVFYTNVPKHYEAYSTATTDEDGHAVLCLPTGKTEVIAKLNDQVSTSQTVDKKAEAESVTLKLDIPTKHVYFKNSETGEAADWPKDIDFKPAISKDVLLPDVIPKLSGRQFTGWNTKKDGTGTSYVPGTKLTLDDNLTLWAQWKKPENVWYVIYNANGGAKAPGPQEIVRGKDAVLTKELPEGTDLVFKGWTEDKHNPQPVYQPGDTLPYDSGKDYVVLYAMWDMTPAVRPVEITFDANGGQLDSVPHKFSVPRLTWFRLSQKEPVWDDQHEFTGWARTRSAAKGTIKPGSAMIFGKDTKLYAIWNAHYQVIEGAGSVWTKGSTQTQRFVADGNVMYFTELRIDGKRFEDGVEITSGSTVAEIKPWAMQKLSVGSHTVTFVYEDGEASATFTVRERKLPPTGDAGRPALWLALALLGITGLVLAVALPRAAGKKK